VDKASDTKIKLEEEKFLEHVTKLVDVDALRISLQMSRHTFTSRFGQLVTKQEEEIL